MNIKDFKRIVLVDDKATTLNEFLVARGDYYIVFCRYMLEQCSDDVEIIVITGDGRFVYDKDNDDLANANQTIFSFPVDLSDDVVVTTFTNQVSAECVENTLFLVDNRIMSSETDTENGGLSNLLIMKLNAKGGCTIKFSSYEHGGDNNYKHRLHFGFASQINLHSASIAAKTFARIVELGGE